MHVYLGFITIMIEGLPRADSEVEMLPRGFTKRKTLNHRASLVQWRETDGKSEAKSQANVAAN